jgi:hypothetical protein
MALTKTQETGKVEVVGPHKAVQVRTDTVVKEDDKEISRNFQRKVLQCGYLNESKDALVNTDISGESTEVQNICNAVWTQAVKDARFAHLKATQP